MMKNATVIFDLDGTLADTLPDIARAVNVVLAQSGHAPLADAVVRNFVGWGSRVLLAKSFAARGQIVSDTETSAAYDAFIAYHRTHLVEGTRLYPGVSEALASLEAEGARLAVCTNKPGVLALGVLEALGVREKFATIVGGDTFAKRKPEPEVLLGCIGRAGGDPSRAVMVGDSRTDVETARRADIPVIVVDFGYADVPATELGADRVIDSFGKLSAAATDLLGRA